MANDPTLDQEEIEQTRQQIRGLVAEIAQLSREELAPEEYYGEFLAKVVSALAARGGVVWTVGDGGGLELAYQINLREASFDREEDRVVHGRTLGGVMRTGEPTLVPPRAGGGEDAPGNPTDFLLVLAPLEASGRVEGVVEIFQRADADPATQRGYLRFLVQMCELAGSWLKTRKLRQFSDRQSHWEQADHFSRIVHESLDLSETAYTIANEGRRLIGCDRASVAVRRGGRYKIESVSGQDKFERRSNVVVLLGRLATKVIATGEPLWYTGPSEDLPPQLEEAIQAYIDESHSKTVAVLPLKKPPPPRDASADRARDRQTAESRSDRDVVGALVLEQIEDHRTREELGPSVDLVCQHGSRALANAAEHDQLFLMPLWRALGRATWVLRARTLPKTLAVAAAVLVALLAMIVVPYDFDMEARGTLQPVRQRNVFAKVDGVVTEVLVKHGQSVHEGQVLVEMKNTELEMEKARVEGDLAETRKELHAVESATLSRDQLSKLSPAERDQLFGRREELKQRLESSKMQWDLLVEKLRNLTVTAPISGRVVTWKVVENLLGRPVVPGQQLMTVADTSGDWELQINVPDARMGHIRRAQKSLGRRLEVTFVTATDPDKRYRGRIKEVHTRAEMHGDEGHGVRVRVEIDKNDLKTAPMPDATVTAKVRCGKKPVGYVLIHQLIEWVELHVLF